MMMGREGGRGEGGGGGGARGAGQTHTHTHIHTHETIEHKTEKKMEEKKSQI